MTQPAYTDADVELVARVISREWCSGDLADADSREGRAVRALARDVLDALVEHGQGLAPVIAHQWSIRYPGGTVQSVGTFTEAAARQRADELAAEAVYRAVGPWISAGEPA